MDALKCTSDFSKEHRKRDRLERKPEQNPPSDHYTDGGAPHAPPPPNVAPTGAAWPQSAQIPEAPWYEAPWYKTKSGRPSVGLCRPASTFSPERPKGGKKSATLQPSTGGSNTCFHLR